MAVGMAAHLLSGGYVTERDVTVHRQRHTHKPLWQAGDTHKHTHTDTHIYIHGHTHIHTHSRTQAHICQPIHARTRTNTHTHTHTLYVWAATRNYADFRIHRHTSSTCICTYDVNTVLWIVYPHKTPTQTGVHGNPERHTLTYEQL